MAPPARIAARGGPAPTHQGFLAHHDFRWLRVALVLSALAITGYLLADVQPRPNGGSWYGYTLGTIGALQILWLTLIGYRKRAMTPGRWSLKGWTSAHVYLGLSLIVIATLHTGFQLGWNVHSLAYGLLMLVIASGLFGMIAYATIPAAMSSNRDGLTEAQLIDGLRAIDRQLHEAAQPLSEASALAVRRALAQDPFGGGLWARLSGRYPRCATDAAHAFIRRWTGDRPDLGDDPLERVDRLLERRQALLARMRRHLRYRALLEIWLYAHVPLSFMLIAALAAHILSVFYFW
ncbi:MAG: hypothetical protein K2X76_10665 [Sphingomonas sp.]|nr:hypothetical protein [Sphingomonas sp.]